MNAVSCTPPYQQVALKRVVGQLRAISWKPVGPEFNGAGFVKKRNFSSVFVDLKVLKQTPESLVFAYIYVDRCFDFFLCSVLRVTNG